MDSVMFNQTQICSISGPLTLVCGADFVCGSEGIVYQFQLHYYS